MLRRISETNSLTEGAKLAEMSYRSAWDRIKAIESSLGIKIVETKVGGATGGGAKLTPEGAALLQDFRKVRKYLFNALEDRQYMVHASYKLSARNRIKAKVTKVEKGPITASVKMTVALPATLTSIISREAVEDLDLKVGRRGRGHNKVHRSDHREGDLSAAALGRREAQLRAASIFCLYMAAGPAPTVLECTSPFLKTIIVGMLIIPNFSAISGFSSVFILTNLAFPTYSFERDSIIGDTILHGPHQSA